MFEADLKVGQLAEDFILPHLEAFTPSEAWRSRLNPYITDIWWRTKAGVFKVEVKYDRKNLVTGNVAIENEAIEKSTSDFVVYLVYPNVCLFTRGEILKLIPHYRQVRGGDFHKPLTLVPRQEFINQSTLI